MPRSHYSDSKVSRSTSHYSDDDGEATYTRSVVSSGSGHSRSISRISSSSKPRSVVPRGSLLPRIVEVDDSEAWDSADEEYVLSRWATRKPTSSFGTPYRESLQPEYEDFEENAPPSARPAYLAIDNKPYRSDRSDAGSRVSGASSRRSSSHRDDRSRTSSRHSAAPRRDSDSDNDRQSRRSSHSRRSHSSRHDGDSDNDGRSRASGHSRRSHSSRAPSNTSAYDAEESVLDRLKRLSLNITRDRDRKGDNSDEDSQAELTIPASHRPSKSKQPASVAGSSTSRRSHRSHRSERR